MNRPAILFVCVEEQIMASRPSTATADCEDYARCDCGRAPAPGKALYTLQGNGLWSFMRWLYTGWR